jgi:enamine deaminase RidA (YjgF/YER057c/UK114 family)
MKEWLLANGMGPLRRWVMNMSCAWYRVGAHRVRSGRWRSTMTSLTFTCISSQTGRLMSNSLIVRATYSHLIVAIVANTSNRNSKTIMSTTKPQTSNPPNVPLPPPTYSQVCVTPLHPTSKLITLAGQTGLQSDGSISASINVQAKNAYQAIRSCLEAAGATPCDIVHVRHYIVKDSGDKEKDKLDVVDRGWGEEWMEFMDREGDGHRPPDTVIGVASLAKKELLYECEVSAIVS